MTPQTNQYRIRWNPVSHDRGDYNLRQRAGQPRLPTVPNTSFPLDRPKRRVVCNPDIFTPLRLVRNNKETENVEVKSKLITPDVVESILLAIFEEGCNTLEAAYHALPQNQSTNYSASY